ncbi:MAG: phospho-sugar mutase [Eubacteriales bacterium]|nr:phospho-sugar mutase [Eubacteriales bacterium]
MANYRENYEAWRMAKHLPAELKTELAQIAGDEAEIEDRFYQDLTFGTAGLRGKLGVGTNRMNEFVVARATKALAKVILAHGEDKKARGVAIAHDCRIMSPEFARVCAEVLAAHGIKVYLFDALRPTPELSFAVRHFGCIAGLNITASHNPKEYNGYKVYWAEGSQIKDDIADAVLAAMEDIGMFDEAGRTDFDEAVSDGLIEIIGKDVDEAYYKAVMSVSMDDEAVDKDIKIVFTPLNGTGNIPVRTVLARMGYKNVTVVKEQEAPDGRFPTVGYPNPEDPAAFKLAAELGRDINADILIATDPDADRLAVQVMEDGVAIPFNGNQIGALLIHYILMQKKRQGTLSDKAAIIKSIVTGDMGKAIAGAYGVKVFEVLTGFKNISELPNIWDKTDEYEYVFGYEESIGFNAGNFVRDKDAVSTALLLAEMAGYYKKRGKNLRAVLEELYETYGYFAEKTVAIALEGIAGKERIGRMMTGIRTLFPETIGDAAAVRTVDYNSGEVRDVKTGETSVTDIERTNAFECRYADGSWFTLRPSGTEPKIKLYIYTKAEDAAASQQKVADIEATVRAVLDKIE